MTPPTFTLDPAGLEELADAEVGVALGREEEEEGSCHRLLSVTPKYTLSPADSWRGSNTAVPI